ncbi:hypothetical protein KY285_010507 [Solanum tuberosum]|nr:hypothetical protein KY289_011051 [Solanum tuberosum]KAH0734800.1 hypothetical protein KY285_010507 [Solanum tuberosum]
MIDWVKTFLRKGVTMYYGSPEKERNQTCPLTTSQSKGHDDSESSSSEVKINTTIEDHSPRATRAQTKRAILQDTHPSLKREEVILVAVKNRVVNLMLVQKLKRDETDVIDEDIEITTDDTMVMYVNIHEPDPAARPYLIDYFRSMWNMNRSKEFSTMFHQFDWMNNAPGENSNHLAREFYSSYAATLMNFVVETEITKRGQKDIAITWGHST